jgi:hypothetical protein
MWSRAGHPCSKRCFSSQRASKPFRELSLRKSLYAVDEGEVEVAV